MYGVQTSACFWRLSLASAGIEDLGLSVHLSTFPYKHSLIVVHDYNSLIASMVSEPERL